MPGCTKVREVDWSGGGWGGEQNGGGFDVAVNDALGVDVL